MITALVGAGKVGVTYADDIRMQRHYKYISHAQVLSEHPKVEWVAVVDANEEARRHVAEVYGSKRHAASVRDLKGRHEIELAIVATPPNGRLDLLEAFPNLRAAIIEKPLGSSTEQTEVLAEYAEDCGIITQVNLWRRADTLYRGLSAGGLTEAIGTVQSINAVYGNGLINNGIHLIDFVRMLVGEVVSGVALGEGQRRSHPIDGDIDVPFCLTLESGVTALFNPVNFEHYRENALEFWGTKGRLSIAVDGLINRLAPMQRHRATPGFNELSPDEAIAIEPTVGTALWNLYDNLFDALDKPAELWSPLRNAVIAEKLAFSIADSAHKFGR